MYQQRRAAKIRNVEQGRSMVPKNPIAPAPTESPTNPWKTGIPSSVARVLSKDNFFDAEGNKVTDQRLDYRNKVNQIYWDTYNVTLSQTRNEDEAKSRAEDLSSQYLNEVEAKIKEKGGLIFRHTP